VQPKAESRKKKPTTRSKAGARTLEKKGTKNASSKLQRANRYFNMMEQRIKTKQTEIGQEIDKLTDKFTSGGIDADEFNYLIQKVYKEKEKFTAARRKRQVKHIVVKAEHEWNVINQSQKRLFDKRDNIANYSYKIEPIPMTESTVKFISRKIYELAKKQIQDVARKYPAGANIYIKAFMQKDGASASAVVKASKVTLKELETIIFNSLSQRVAKHYPTQDYILDITNIDILVSGFGAKGGCNNKKTSHERIQIRKDAVMHLTNHKSINNNCLIQCFNHAYGVAGNKLKASVVRKALGLEEDTRIHMKMIPKMSKFYNERFPDQKKGYVLINQNNEVVLFHHPCEKKQEDVEEVLHDADDDNELVKLFLKDKHYFTYDMIIYRKCDTCGRKLFKTNETHECNKQMASYYSAEVTGKKDIVRSFKIEEPKINYDQMVYWDAETFQPEEDGIRHEMYASAYMAANKYHVYYGKKSMDETIDDFLTFEGKTVTAYNGSGFDYYFLIDKLTERNAVVEDLIINQGKVMSFSFRLNSERPKNKMFDLYLFTMTSLASACADFKIEDAKSSFDHEKMKSWKDTKTYRHEVEPYLKLDVLALKELFEKFNDMMWEIKNINITQFVTASHMGYSIWQNELDQVVEIPKCIDKLGFIKKAIYGGRCYPHQYTYKSKLYDQIADKKKSYDDLLKSGDFIFNADASSLYPASMAGFEHMAVEYPIGKSRWSDTPADEYANNKIGFYEVNFIPPKDLRIPILPRKKLNNGVIIGIEWSLFDGQGIYTSIDIKNALEAGYQIQFIGKALVYDKSGDVFSKYIKTFYELKGKAEKEGNDCLRSIAKLLLNSLYGKMLMSPITSSTSIINNAYDFHNFFTKNNLTEYAILNDRKIMLTGDVKDADKVKKITKPSQLGAFVTAYSRRIMLFYMKEIDPTLKSTVFTYTDTDSLHIYGEAYLTLMKKGLIKTKKDATLGFLCSDIKNEGFIIFEKNCAPKTYMYTYIDSTGKIDTTMKCKGIPKKKLKEIDFEEHGRPIEFTGLKKKNKLTLADREKGVTLFSVCNNKQTRTFMKNEWKGMPLVGNEFYPRGYNLKI